VYVDCCGEGYAEDKYEAQELTTHVLWDGFVYSKRVNLFQTQFIGKDVNGGSI
jgi:hypothetical protein